MRKSLALLLALLLVATIGLCACSGDGDDPAETTPTSDSQPTDGNQPGDNPADPGDNNKSEINDDAVYDKATGNNNVANGDWTARY